MIDTMDPILDAWFSLLKDQLTYGGEAVNVYPGDPANNDYKHHVILRAESETDDSNKSSFVTKPVIVVDIVTVHSVSVNKSIVSNIYGQIMAIVFPTRKCALPALSDLQVSNVIPQGSTYLQDEDGSYKYYRKSTRFIHRVLQTNT